MAWTVGLSSRRQGARPDRRISLLFPLISTESNPVERIAPDRTLGVTPPSYDLSIAYGNIGDVAYPPAHMDPLAWARVAFGAFLAASVTGNEWPLKARFWSFRTR
jgi:hypothetical protein